MKERQPNSPSACGDRGREIMVSPRGARSTTLNVSTVIIHLVVVMSAFCAADRFRSPLDKLL
jgi:hypothetical protein